MLNKPPAYIRAYETAKAHGLASVLRPPGHSAGSDKNNKTNSDKNNKNIGVHWNKNLTIRFHISGNEILDYHQPVIDQTEMQNNMTPTIYLMLSSLALDTSRREILYRTYWSEPMPNNDRVDFVLNY